MPTNPTATVEFDINKVVAEVAVAYADRLWDSLAGPVKRNYNSFKTLMPSTFESYLTSVVGKYTLTKNLFFSREPGYLYRYYVPLDIGSHSRVIERASLKAIHRHGNHVVLQGLAGCGKSTLMRHLLCTCIFEKVKIPIFVELRSLNGMSLSIEEAVLEELSRHDPRLDRELGMAALRAGQTAIFLDGFDEIETQRRSRTTKEILKFVDRFPENILLVSTRPDREFTGWVKFTTYDVRPLTLHAAVSLIKVLPFDEIVKSRFMDQLEESLFSSHQSFMANPLLLTIMLLTYSRNASVPTKMSLFYEQAYEALYHRHDATKEAFERPKSCGLDLYDFSRVFAAFSIQSYLKQEFRFSSENAMRMLRNAKNVTATEFNETEFLTDAQRSVSLMVEDGLELSYAHRSFQEYFAAKFISEAPTKQKAELMKQVSRRLDLDTVGSLLLEMDRDSVESVLLLPFCEDFLRRLM